MCHRLRSTRWLLIGLALCLRRRRLDRRATWSIPTTAEVKARLDDYLANKTLDEAARLKIEALWPDDAQPLDGGELLDRLTASLAVVEPKAAEVVDACRRTTCSLAAAEIRRADRRIAAAAGSRQPAAARRPLAGAARPGR